MDAGDSLAKRTPALSIQGEVHGGGQRAFKQRVLG